MLIDHDTLGTELRQARERQIGTTPHASRRIAANMHEKMCTSSHAAEIGLLSAKQLNWARHCIM